MRRVNKLIACLLATIFAISIGAVGVNAACPTIGTIPRQEAKIGIAFNTLNISAYVSNDHVADTYDISNADGLVMSVDPSSGVVSYGDPLEGDWGVHSITVELTPGNTSCTTTITKTFDLLVSYPSDEGTLVFDDVEVDGDNIDLGERGDTFLPGDEIKVEFKLENTEKNEDWGDISDITVEGWLEKKGDQLGDEIEIENIDVNADDVEKDLELTLEIPLDADEDGWYTLYLWAHEGENDNDMEKSDVFYAEIEIEREKYDILIPENEIIMTPKDIVCGLKSVKLEIPIYNIGTKDIEEDDELVLEIFNTDLGIKEEIEIKENIDAADDETFELYLDIPSKATENFFLTFEIDDPKNNYDDERMSITIESTCGDDAVTPGLASVLLDQTSLTSTPGSRGSFRATIENTGTEDSTFGLSLLDADDWSDWQITPISIDIGAGDSETVLVSLTPKANMFGQKTATLNVKSGNEIVGSKTLTVNVVGSDGIATATASLGHTIPKQILDGGIQAGLVGLIIVLVIVAVLMFAFRPQK